MRKYLLGSILMLVFGWVNKGVLAQSSPVDVFQSVEPVTPKYYANGLIAHLVEADNLLRRGRFEEAIIAYDNALVIDPYFAEGYIKRAVAKFRLGRKNEAEQDYRLALRYNPYAADLHGYKGSFSRIRILAFDRDDMLAIPEEEKGVHPLYGDAEYQLLLNRVIELKTSGSIPAALHAVNQAIALNRDLDARLFKLRGNLYILLNDFRKAIADYDHAITLDGAYEQAYFNRGLANLLVNNRPDACSDMEKSIQLGYREGTDKMKYFCGY